MTPRVVCLCGQRAAGKQAVKDKLLGAFPNLHRVVPHTTRAPGPCEVDGRDCHFVSSQDFSNLVGEGKLVWWVAIGPNQQAGTVLDELFANGEASVLDVLPKGARKMREYALELGGNALLIGITADECERIARIKRSQPEVSEDEIKKLMSQDPVSQDELQDFDLVVHNPDGSLELTCQKVIEKVEAFLHA